MDEQNLKSFIRSLLTSSPHDLTIKQLQRDFYEMIGMRIPFGKLGYTSVEHLLKSLPDTCTVMGSGEFATVRPVITNKVAHINAMVTRQKVTTRRNFQGSRRRAPTYTQSQIEPSTSRGVNSSTIYPQVARNINETSEVAQNSNIIVPKLMSLNLTSSGASNYTSDYETTPSNKDFEKNVAEFSKLSDDSFKMKIAEPKLQYTQITESIKRAIRDSDQNDIVKKHRERINSRKSDESQRKSDEQKIDSKPPPVESRIPDRVQENLKILINKYPEGIWCLDLPKKYRETFKRELRIADYGYTSLMVMCLDLRHIFHCVRQDYGDYMLYDCSKSIPTILTKDYRPKIYNKTSGGKSYVVGNEKTALPEKTDWGDFLDCIPTDIVTIGETISRQFLDEDCKTDSVIDIVMVEIYDPSKFWFYLADSEPELDAMMNDMQDFYREPEIVKRYLVPQMLIQEGLYCVQRIFGEYHRAILVDVMPDVPNFVKLLYFDYGTLTRAPSEGICFLHRRFSELPTQAIRGRLSNIVPPYKETTWCVETNEYLRKVTSGRKHRAKICDVDRRMLSVSIFLADVTDGDPTKYFYINEMLVKEGKAIWADQEQKVLPLLPNVTCQVKQIHLYPTFVELEYGLAPNVNAMLTLESLKTPLAFCYPQYFDLNNRSSNDAQSLELSEENHVKRVVARRSERCRMKFDLKKIRESSKIDWEVFGECEGPIREFLKSRGDRLSDSEDEDEFFCDLEEEESIKSEEECQKAVKEEEEDRRVKEIQETYKMSEDIIQEIGECMDLSKNVKRELESIKEEAEEKMTFNATMQSTNTSASVENWEDRYISSSSGHEEKAIEESEEFQDVIVESVEIETMPEKRFRIEENPSWASTRDEDGSLKVEADCRSSDEGSNVTVRHLLQDLNFFQNDTSSDDTNNSPEKLSTTPTFSVKSDRSAPTGRTSRITEVMGKVSCNPFKTETTSSYSSLHPNNPFREYLEDKARPDALSSREKVTTWISTQKFNAGSNSSSEFSVFTGKNVSTGTQTTLGEVRGFQPQYPMVTVPFVPAMYPRWSPGFYPRAVLPPPPGFAPQWVYPAAPRFPCVGLPGYPRVPQMDGETASSSEDSAPRVELKKNDLKRVDVEKVKEFVPRSSGSFICTDVDSIQEFVPRGYNP